jgi:hypothetical protein
MSWRWRGGREENRGGDGGLPVAEKQRWWWALGHRGEGGFVATHARREGGMARWHSAHVW